MLNIEQGILNFEVGCSTIFNIQNSLFSVQYSLLLLLQLQSRILTQITSQQSLVAYLSIVHD
jgi:hypothetical protein